MNYELVYGVANTLTSVINWILGMAVVILSTYTVFITSIDIAYISFSNLRDIVNRSISIEEILSGKKFTVISKDAILAVNDSAKNNRSVLVSYLFRRIKTFIIIAIMLSFMFGGSQVITDVIYKVVYSIVTRVFQ